MRNDREQTLEAFKSFLRTIQKPNKPVESIGLDDNLVESGLIDSLAIIEIVMYLEKSHGIDFAVAGVDPDRLASMSGILDIVDEARR